MNDLEREVWEEETLTQAKIITDLGFVTNESFVRFREEAVMGMARFGDEFLHGIAIALKFAELKDAVRLIKVWRNDISQHQMLEQIYQAQQKAKKEQENVGSDA